MIYAFSNPHSITVSQSILKPHFPVPVPPKSCSCFSFYTNQACSGEKALDIFNAIKVLSIGWAVLGHSFLLWLYSTVVLNMGERPQRMTHWPAAFLYEALFSVNAFFWMSGMLFAYLVIDKFRSNGGVNWPVLYIHPFIGVLRSTCSSGASPSTSAEGLCGSLSIGLKQTVRSTGGRCRCLSITCTC